MQDINKEKLLDNYKEVRRYLFEMDSDVTKLCRRLGQNASYSIRALKGERNGHKAKEYRHRIYSETIYKA